MCGWQYTEQDVAHSARAAGPALEDQALHEVALMPHAVAINPLELALVVTPRPTVDVGVVEADSVVAIVVAEHAAEAVHQLRPTALQLHRLRRLRAGVMLRERTPFPIKEASRSRAGRKTT